MADNHSGAATCHCHTLQGNWSRELLNPLSVESDLSLAMGVLKPVTPCLFHTEYPRILPFWNICPLLKNGFLIPFPCSGSDETSGYYCISGKPPEAPGRTFSMQPLTDLLFLQQFTWTMPETTQPRRTLHKTWCSNCGWPVKNIYISLRFKVIALLFILISSLALVINEVQHPWLRNFSAKDLIYCEDQSNPTESEQNMLLNNAMLYAESEKLMRNYSSYGLHNLLRKRLNGWFRPAFLIWQLPWAMAQLFQVIRAEVSTNLDMNSNMNLSKLKVQSTDDGRTSQLKFRFTSLVILSAAYRYAGNWMITAWKGQPETFRPKQPWR